MMSVYETSQWLYRHLDVREQRQADFRSKMKNTDGLQVHKVGNKFAVKTDDFAFERQLPLPCVKRGRDGRQHCISSLLVRMLY
jgi:hypothetical protein